MGGFFIVQEALSPVRTRVTDTPYGSLYRSTTIIHARKGVYLCPFYGCLYSASLGFSRFSFRYIPLESFEHPVSNPQVLKGLTGGKRTSELFIGVIPLRLSDLSVVKNSLTVGQTGTGAGTPVQQIKQHPLQA